MMAKVLIQVQSMQWKIKRETNDDLRQQFIDKTIPQAELIGLKVPDQDAVWNPDTNHYDTSDLDWDEFWNVIKGNGPCNKQRLASSQESTQRWCVGKRCRTGVRQETE